MVLSQVTGNQFVLYTLCEGVIYVLRRFSGVDGKFFDLMLVFSGDFFSEFVARCFGTYRRT